MTEQFTSFGLITHFYNVQQAMHREWDTDPSFYPETRLAAYVALHYCVYINGDVPPEGDSFAGLVFKAAASVW